ncbi:MAG TPA: site-specific integrase [Candidatus Eisenbacteria bacterium]|nr:site-specific integrase [Candidatus Eisenbacteria bacterium]
MGKTGNPADASARERIGERVVIFLRGDRWWAQYNTAKTQHRVPLKTSNLKRARQEAIRIEAALLDGTYRAPERTPLLSDMAAQYLAHLKVEDRSASTLKRYEPELDRIVQFAAAHGAKRVSDFTVKLFDAYRATRVAHGAEPATVYHESTLIKQLFNFAVRRDVLVASPLKNVKLKKPAKSVQPIFTLAQVEEILAHASVTWKPVFEFLACAGLRIGELCWLHWADIDLESGFIQVRAKEGWRPKDRDDRRVPINDRLRTLIDALPRSEGWVFTGKPCEKYPAGGQRISERRALSALKRVLTKAGIDEGKLHTFRHFFICHCLLNGVAPNVVAEWVGHSSLEMVMRYFHLLKDQSRQAMVNVSFQSVPKANSAVKLEQKSGAAG